MYKVSRKDRSSRYCETKFLLFSKCLLVCRKHFFHIHQVCCFRTYICTFVVERCSLQRTGRASKCHQTVLIRLVFTSATFKQYMLLIFPSFHFSVNVSHLVFVENIYTAVTCVHANDVGIHSQTIIFLFSYGTYDPHSFKVISSFLSICEKTSASKRPFTI